MERPITELTGLFSDEEVEEIREVRGRSYEAYSGRRREKAEKYF